MIFAAPFFDGDGNGLDEEWEVIHFGEPGLTSALDDDSDDGVVNLRKLFHGRDPTVASTDDGVEILLDEERVRLRFPMAPTLLIHSVEWSHDHTSWTEFPADAVAFSWRPDLGQGPGWSMVELGVPLPVGEAPVERAFFRLRVTAPE